MEYSHPFLFPGLLLLIAAGLMSVVVGLALAFGKMLDKRRGIAVPQLSDDLKQEIPSSIAPAVASAIWYAYNRIEEVEIARVKMLAKYLTEKYLEMLPTATSLKMRIRLDEPVSGTLLQKVAAALIQQGWFVQVAEQGFNYRVEIYPTKPSRILYDQSKHTPHVGVNW